MLVMCGVTLELILQAVSIDIEPMAELQHCH